MPKVKRNELYDQVWTEPMTSLSKQYGISDVGLRKICINMGIPTPPIGYWARIQAGHDVPKPVLPAFDSKKHVETYNIEPTIKAVPLIPDEQLEQQLTPVKDIFVPDMIYKPHPLISEAIGYYKKAHIGSYGELYCSETTLHLRVSKGQLDRALLVMDTVIKGLDALRFKVENNKEKRETFVTVHGTPVHFYIDERFKQVDHVPSVDEKQRAKRSIFDSWQKFDYHSSGELTFKITDYPDGCKKSWGDGKHKLEDQIGEILRGIMVAAAAMKKHHLRLEEQSRRWMEEAAQKEIEKQQKIDEEKRLLVLEQDAASWIKSKQIKEYVASVRDVIDKSQLPPEKIDAYLKWETWALKHAEILDASKRIVTHFLPKTVEH